MRHSVYSIVLFWATFLAVISSCDKAPVPESSWVPEFARLYSVPGTTSAELVAELKTTPSGGTRYAFYYGTDQTVIKRIEATQSGKTIRANVSGLTPEIKYYFNAYVSNGRIEKI